MSPSGIEAFMRKKAQKEEQKARREAGGGDPSQFTNDFRLRDGQFAVVRFLEQGDDLTFSETHRVPIQGRSKRYFKSFICRNFEDDGTPCPACQHENPDVSKRITRGFVNMIWRDAPVYQRDEKKRLVKDPQGNLILVEREDQIALWPCSWTVFEQLKEKDSKYHGLMSRDWEIKRTGSSMDDTKYFIEPAVADGGPSPMTIADMSLAEGKYDLVALTTPLSFEAFASVLVNGSLPNGPQPTQDRSSVLPTGHDLAEGPQVRASAFQRA